MTFSLSVFSLPQLSTCVVEIYMRVIKLIDPLLVYWRILPAAESLSSISQSFSLGHYPLIYMYQPPEGVYLQKNPAFALRGNCMKVN